MSPSSTVAADSDVVSCALAPRHESVRTAREFTKLTLNRWQLTDLFDDIALVASELVTNALRHALAPASAPMSAPVSSAAQAYTPAQRGSGWGRGAQDPISNHLDTGHTPAPLIRLSLVRRAPQVVCAVSDPSTNGPVAREADFIAESGRGLHLVDSFSQSWGWHPVAAGKVVWALFDLSGGKASGTAGREPPRRTRRAGMLPPRSHPRPGGSRPGRCFRSPRRSLRRPVRPHRTVPCPLPLRGHA
ncbi:ATP-binding protein [Streptacidiphilus sp. 4-A2]|nr:ATP-binding protein [Streptacidiphilus sp. 4-A2]